MPPADGEAASKRNLVRWDDDKDKQLLLCLQYVCANAGIRIPWDDVARQMGPKFSGGACVQHLAKLRSRMEEEEIPVPPPLARGLVTTKPSSVYAKNGAPRKRKTKTTDDAEETPPPNPSTSPVPSKKRKIKKEAGIKEESDAEMPDLYDDSDDDGYAPAKKKKGKAATKSKSKKKKNAKQNAGDTTPEADNSDKTPTPPPTGSANMRTRGNRVNYAIPPAPIDDDIPSTATPVVATPVVSTPEPIAAAPEQREVDEPVKTEDTAAAPQTMATFDPNAPASFSGPHSSRNPGPFQSQQMQTPAPPYYQDFSGGYNPAFTWGTPSRGNQPGWGPSPSQFMTAQQYYNPQQAPPYQQDQLGNPFSSSNEDFNNALGGLSPSFMASAQSVRNTGGFAKPKKTSASEKAHGTNESGKSTPKAADVSRNSSLQSSMFFMSQDMPLGLPQYGTFPSFDDNAGGAGGNADFDDPSFDSFLAPLGGDGDMNDGGAESMGIDGGFDFINFDG